MKIIVVSISMFRLAHQRRELRYDIVCGEA